METLIPGKGKTHRAYLRAYIQHTIASPSGRTAISICSRDRCLSRIGDFKGNRPFQGLRAAIDASETHIEMHVLVRSIRDHNEMPSTFDGE
jgi:hypothetical protein